MIRARTVAQLGMLAAGVVGWAYGTATLSPASIGLYGVLASAGPWFLLGFVAILLGSVVEIWCARPRGWMFALYLAALIVAIHTTVAFIYGTPEYAWVYKHIGIASAFARFGRVTDPNSIYQQWPVMFAGTAALARLAHLGAASFAAWAPVAFELADALLLLAAFRLLVGERRIGYLAIVLYEGLVSWVGQDYLSPQAFAYLLWLGIVVILLRWLRDPAQVPAGRFGRLRAPLLTGLPAAPGSTSRMRTFAVALVVLLYFAIVAAHQLTPYVALAGVATLTALGLVRPRWLLLVLAGMAGGYLAVHYSLISEQFGGLFSGGNPLSNASGVRGVAHPGPQATVATVVRFLAAGMWVLTLIAIMRRRREPGRIVIAAALAFSPFAILVAQRYGGEAVYRVYMFSAPWCALLIAEMLVRIRAVAWRSAAIAVACAVAVFAGVEGLYGPVAVRAFTAAELDASTWLYAHIPQRSLVVLPDDNFPALQTADYAEFDVQAMPSDPQLGQAWLDETNLAAVEQWIVKLGYRRAYVVTSRSMKAYAEFFGSPAGYARLARTISSYAAASPVYRNRDVTIYRLDVR